MNKSKKTMLVLLVVVMLVAAAAVCCIGMRVAPAVNHALRISELLQPVLDAKNQTMHIAVSTAFNGDSFDLESDVFLVSEDGIPYVIIQQNGAAVYVADHVLFLENGKAFKIGDKLQTQAVSYKDLLPQIGMLYEALAITAEETETETAYSITVTGQQVAALLKTASFGDALAAVEGVEKLNLCLTEKNGKLDQIRFFGNGELDGTSVALDVSLYGFRLLASGDYPIPEAVKQSAATVNPEELFSLTEDLYRLVLALAPLANMESIDGTLELTVDCGMLQLDSKMALSDLKTASDDRLDPQMLQALPEVLGWLCMEGDLSCTGNGNAYIYKLVLDRTSMMDLSRMILPELAQYGGDLTEGTIAVTLVNSAIASMNVSIKGKISAWIAQIPVTVGAEFRFD